MDMVEPVDLLENLKKTDYKEKLKGEEGAEPKWNMKVAAMDLIIAGCGSPPKLIVKASWLNFLLLIQTVDKVDNDRTSRKQSSASGRHLFSFPGHVALTHPLILSPPKPTPASTP